ncbi:MAG: hypothetical protein WC824_07690 [Bacteroidota bacterium]|jgi:hypothetical protein
MGLEEFALQLLQAVFPGGTLEQVHPEGELLEDEKDPFARDEGVEFLFHVGPYLILPLQTHKGLKLQWRTVGDSAFGTRNKGMIEDTFLVENGENDVLGWVSHVREKIIHFAYQFLAKSLDPADLFPVGSPRKLRGFRQLRPSIQVLKECGEKIDPDRIRKALPHPILWKDGKVDPVQGFSPRFAFEVKGSPGGHVVGRLGAEWGITGFPLFDYGIKILIADPRLDRLPVTLSEKESNIDTFGNILPAKQWLENRYFELILAWAEKRLREENPLDSLVGPMTAGKRHYP